VPWEKNCFGEILFDSGRGSTQKKLSEGIQLDAIEMVRRSERALGLAVRHGQSTGQVARRGDAGGTSGLRGNATRTSRGEHLESSDQYFGSDVERNAVYQVTDDVTPEQYDLAISVAKDEGNLSRANVVRKVQEVKSGAQQREDTPGACRSARQAPLDTRTHVLRVKFRTAPRWFSCCTPTSTNLGTEVRVLLRRNTSS
jgi:hypothetical protein